MTHFYVVLDTDDDDNLVVKPTQKTDALELFAQQGTFPAWNIVGEGYIVTIYGGALEAYSCWREPRRNRSTGFKRT